jgi:hypothetical protein
VLILSFFIVVIPFTPIYFMIIKFSLIFPCLLISNRFNHIHRVYVISFSGNAKGTIITIENFEVRSSSHGINTDATIPVSGIRKVFSINMWCNRNSNIFSKHCKPRQQHQPLRRNVGWLNRAVRFLLLLVFHH